MPCHAHAVPLPCRATLIHTCHASPLLFSNSAVFFVKVRGNIRNASITVWRIGMLLITIFVEIRVIAGRSRTRAGRLHAVSGQPMLIHTRHAMPVPRPCRAVPWPWEVAFRTAWSWHGMCESNTAELCKSNGKDTIQTVSGTVWKGHVMVYVN
jgi:hypothetical protein